MTTGVVDIVAHLLETLSSDWARHASGRELHFVLGYVREVLAAAVATQHAFSPPTRQQRTGCIDDSAAPDGPLNRSADAGQRGRSVQVFHREREYWTLGYDTVTVRVKHTTGLFYIAYLLRRPEREVHSIELVNALNTADSKRCVEGISVPHLRTSQGAAGELLDDQAMAQYHHRLSELRAELDQAEQFNDTGRSEHLRAEIEAISEQLAAAGGLGGCDRNAASSAERARATVTQRIKTAITRIAAVSPELADHLAHRVKTGRFCVYRPDPARPIRWMLD